jgi:hypothetical protein
VNPAAHIDQTHHGAIVHSDAGVGVGQAHLGAARIGSRTGQADQANLHTVNVTFHQVDQADLSAAHAPGSYVDQTGFGSTQGSAIDVEQGSL